MKIHELTFAPFILLLAFWLISPASAEVVRDLYEARVEVESQSQAHRSRATREALAEVLVKLTGSRDAARDASTARLRAQASSYLNHYSYEFEQILPESEEETAEQASQERLFARFGFDPVTLSQELQKLQVPVWSQQRPAIVAWVVLQQNASRRFLSPHDDHEVVNELQAVASERGLPLLFPLMDLEDQLKLRVGEVWAGFWEPVEEASSRYRADGILVLRLTELFDGQWQSESSLWIGGAETRWQHESDDINQLANTSLHAGVDMLVEQYRGSGREQEAVRSIQMQVSGLASLADLYQATRFLENMGMIDRVRLQSLSGQTAALEIRLNQSPTQLRRALELQDSKLHALQAEDTSSGSTIPDPEIWSYHLSGRGLAHE